MTVYGESGRKACGSYQVNSKPTSRISTFSGRLERPAEYQYRSESGERDFRDFSRLSSAQENRSQPVDPVSALAPKLDSI